MPKSQTRNRTRHRTKRTRHRTRRTRSKTRRGGSSSEQMGPLHSAMLRINRGLSPLDEDSLGSIGSADHNPYAMRVNHRRTPSSVDDGLLEEFERAILEDKPRRRQPSSSKSFDMLNFDREDEGEDKENSRESEQQMIVRPRSKSKRNTSDKKKSASKDKRSGPKSSSTRKNGVFNAVMAGNTPQAENKQVLLPNVAEAEVVPNVFHDIINARDSVQDYVHDTCPICFEPLGLEPNVITECNHIFHNDCLLGWCRAKGAKPTCPVCRADIQPTCYDIIPFDSMEIFRYVGPGKDKKNSGTTGDYNYEMAIRIMDHKEFNPNIRAKYYETWPEKSLFWLLARNNDELLLKKLLARPDIKLAVDDVTDYVSQKHITRLIPRKKIPKQLKMLLG
jgi:hypothetical protein